MPLSGNAIADIEKRLEAARKWSERADAKDYRRANPRRVAKEAQEQADARRSVAFWEWALTAAKEAAAAGIRLRPDSERPTMDIVVLEGPDGRPWPVGPGDFRDRLDTLTDPARYQAHLAAHQEHMRQRPITIGDFRKLLPGANRNRLKEALLHETGFADENGLTDAGKDCGYFVEREGEFGTFYLLTLAGIAWAYRRYLAGDIPLIKGASPARVHEIEDRIDADTGSGRSARQDLPAG